SARLSSPVAFLTILAYCGVLLHESLFALLVVGHLGPAVLGFAVAATVFALWQAPSRRQRVGGRSQSPGTRPVAVRPHGPGVPAMLTTLRFKDVALLQGPPVMGVVFGWTSSPPNSVGSLVLFLLAAWLLVGHVFYLNDWADIETDRRDLNKVGQTFWT